MSYPPSRIESAFLAATVPAPIPASTGAKTHIKTGLASKRGFGGRLSPTIRLWLGFDDGDDSGDATLAMAVIGRDYSGVSGIGVGGLFIGGVAPSINFIGGFLSPSDLTFPRYFAIVNGANGASGWTEYD